jgi:hypothetical protein
MVIWSPSARTKTLFRRGERPQRSANWNPFNLFESLIRPDAESTSYQTVLHASDEPAAQIPTGNPRSGLVHLNSEKYPITCFYCPSNRTSCIQRACSTKSRTQANRLPLDVLTPKMYVRNKNLPPITLVKIRSTTELRGATSTRRAGHARPPL